MWQGFGVVPAIMHQVLVLAGVTLKVPLFNGTFNNQTCMEALHFSSRFKEISLVHALLCFAFHILNKYTISTSLLSFGEIITKLFPVHICLSLAFIT